MRRVLRGVTGWLPLLLTTTVALGACGWRDSVLTLRADAGGAGADAAGLVLEECPAVPGAPSAVAPIPTRAQVALQRTELTAYLHFGLNTFDGTEYGNPAV